ncbi:hypothetical protein P8C59_003513 [Phyllachora maydis]|uniref:Uncharacterized protein n=1 Tax=Phyllachora maydis TaxID=1825666 RepID=A0AAD9MAE9_9PEZI|nr:hypothetical protein P8C59_003513 [Phyllachora maydis]
MDHHDDSRLRDKRSWRRCWVQPWSTLRTWSSPTARLLDQPTSNLLDGGLVHLVLGKTHAGPWSAQSWSC